MQATCGLTSHLFTKRGYTARRIRKIKFIAEPNMALQKQQISLRSAKNAREASPAAGGVDASVKDSLLEAFEPVLVADPAAFGFDGSLTKAQMIAVLRWLTRDVAPMLLTKVVEASAKGVSAEKVLDDELPKIIADARALEAAAKESAEEERKLKAQMGGEEIYGMLPKILTILRCRPLFGKAQALGRTCNALSDEAMIATALQGLPLKSATTVAILFHALIGEVQMPGKLVSAIVPVAGGTSEAAIRRSGFAPLIESLLAHAQNQVGIISQQNGMFSDADLICRAIIRFHRLIRAATAIVDMERGARWSRLAAEITKSMSMCIEPRLREVSADVSQSMRKAREGVDRVDSARLLQAVNGMYLLATVRDARESIALNALFEKVWQETGQTLETLIDRNLELFKQNPSDTNTAERLDMGIKMAEVRFNPEYAEILRRAYESVARLA